MHFYRVLIQDEMGAQVRVDPETMRAIVGRDQFLKFKDDEFERAGSGQMRVAGANVYRSKRGCGNTYFISGHHVGEVEKALNKLEEASKRVISRIRASTKKVGAKYRPVVVKEIYSRSTGKWGRKTEIMSGVNLSLNRDNDSSYETSARTLAARLMKSSMFDLRHHVCN